MFSHEKTRCPEPPLLERFLREELDESSELELQQHIEACATCRAALEETAGSRALWANVSEHLGGLELESNEAQPRSQSEFTPEGQLRQLVELLSPTDDPAMLGRLGSYEVCGLIGRGSTGLVVKAFEPRLARYVAIKLMLPAYGAIGAARTRFEREGRAVAAVSHEHVVPIHAVDEHRGLPYIVMQYVPGPSLQQRIERDGPLDTCEVTRVGLQVARGLAAAHAQGIVHRDVKPANVILEDNVDRAMVTDFGLARVTDEASVTRSGTITGTPEYMSPEQARGESVDQRTDLFSLGSLMYAACTGRPPFRAETVFGVIHRVSETEPRPIRELQPEIAEWLVAFIGKLMDKRPEERFATAEAAADALSEELAFLQNPTATARPTRRWLAGRMPGRTGGGRSRLGLLAAGLAAMLLAVLGLAAVLDSSGDRDDEPGALLGATPGLAVAPQIEILHRTNASSESGEITWTQQASDLDRNAPLSFDQQLVRSFPVEPGGAFTLRVDRADVVVRPGDEPEVSVTVLRRLSAERREEAERLVAGHRLAFEPRAKGLTLTSGFVEGFEEKDRFRRVLIRVNVPAGTSADIECGRGDISVGALQGDVTVRTDAGDIELEHVDGEVWARATGDIDASEGCTGPAEIFTIGGDICLANVQEKARARTSSGHIRLGASPGTVRAQTSGGNVWVSELEGPTRAHACGGDVLVRVTESPVEDARFSAAAGNVMLALADSVATNLEAQGELEADVPFETQESEGGAEALSVSRLNGGGSTLRAVSTSGTVQVRTFDAERGEDSGLGGSGLGGSGLGGSGLGGSGGSSKAKRLLTEAARLKTSGAPRAGALVTVPLDGDSAMDGYTLYLPVSFDERTEKIPVLVYLQGSFGVGGPIGDLNHWGLPRLLRDEHDLSTERNRLLLDGFVVVSPHIQEGQYHDHPEVVQGILERVFREFKGDPDRVVLTGLSRGGHGTWGLADRLPDTFAAIVPIGGEPFMVEDFTKLARPAVWIAHNVGDSVASFGEAVSASRRIEAASGVDFLRLDRIDVTGTDYLDRRYVFSAPRRAGHDAWTDLYTSAAFYRWLLQQSRRGPLAVPADSSGRGTLFERLSEDRDS